MKRSTDRFLTTHTGSLPRPPALIALLQELHIGGNATNPVLEREIESATKEVVRKQAEAGVTVINDGEQGKSNFFLYRQQRLSGFESRPVKDAPPMLSREHQDFPEFYEHLLNPKIRAGSANTATLCCTGPVGWQDFSEVERDIANLKAATQGVPHSELFMSAISPGCYLPRNLHYKSEEEYLSAVVDVMEREYSAIVEAGFVLQIDSPDLTVYYRGREMPVEEHLAYMRTRVDAINHATRKLPADRVRVHVCWGADEAPHHRDIPLKEIVGELMRLRPSGVTIAGANGRHSHEWQVWKDVKLPADKVIIPGVIDSTTNIIEHPEAVAERIINYASVLGPENVIAGVDCGFDTASGGMGQVDTRIVWAKLRSLADGAEIASKRLF